MKRFALYVLVLLAVFASFASCANTKENNAAPQGTEDTTAFEAKGVGQKDDGGETATAEAAEQGDILSTLTPEQVKDKYDRAIEVFRKKGLLGSETYLIGRPYIDTVYNMNFLYQIFNDEPLLAEKNTLDTWVETVLIPLSVSGQNTSVPDLYRAIRDLGIEKEALIAVNEVRKSHGEAYSYHVLSENVINALYAPEEEMIQAFLNPWSLYYEGEVYTIDSVARQYENGETENPLPSSVIDAFIDQVVKVCEEKGWLQEEDRAVIYAAE